jgi:hypothetical protein
MKTKTIGLFLAISFTIFVSCAEKKTDEKNTEKKTDEPTQKKVEEKVEEKVETKKTDDQDLTKKLLGKWKQVKIEQPKTDGSEGKETLKGEGFITFTESTFEEDNTQQKRKGKWKFVKLPKEMMEAEKVIAGIDLGTNPDMGDYQIKSINDKEMILIPQGGEASIMSYYYQKVK